MIKKLRGDLHDGQTVDCIKIECSGCLYNDYSPEVTWSVCLCNWSHGHSEKFAKMRHIGDVGVTWISHQKKSAPSTPTDVLCIGEICLGISSPLIFYSPDDCC